MPSSVQQSSSTSFWQYAFNVVAAPCVAYTVWRVYQSTRKVKSLTQFPDYPTPDQVHPGLAKQLTDLGNISTLPKDCQPTQENINSLRKELLIAEKRAFCRTIRGRSYVTLNFSFQREKISIQQWKTLQNLAAMFRNTSVCVHVTKELYSDLENTLRGSYGPTFDLKKHVNLQGCPQVEIMETETPPGELSPNKNLNSPRT
jgi:hypothetical protein